MKSFKKNSIILILITIVVLVIVLKDDFFNIMNALKNADILFLILSLACLFVGLFFEAIAYKDIIKAYQYDYTIKKAYKMLFITKFFNGITPFSTGGQPMQIYMLKKDGVRVTKATNIIIQNFIIYQAALVLFGIVAILINHYNHIFEEVLILKQLVLLGFLMNTLVMAGLIVISFSSKFNHFIIKLTINLLYKLHIVKNKEETLENWKEKVDDFHKGTDYLKKNKLLCLKTFICNILYLGLTYVMPFFVIASINHGGIDGFTPMKAICSSAYILIMGSFVPIPGASGGIEYGYYVFIGNFVSGTLLKTSLLVWRGISYYVPMIVGGLLFSINTKGDKK